MPRPVQPKEQTVQDKLHVAFGQCSIHIEPDEKTHEYPRCLDGLKTPHYHRWYIFGSGTNWGKGGKWIYHEDAKCLDCGVHRERTYPMQIIHDPDTTYYFNGDGT